MQISYRSQRAYLKRSVTPTGPAADYHDSAVRVSFWLTVENGVEDFALRRACRCTGKPLLLSGPVRDAWIVVVPICNNQVINVASQGSLTKRRWHVCATNIQDPPTAFMGPVPSCSKNCMVKVYVVRQVVFFGEVCMILLNEVVSWEQGCSWREGEARIGHCWVRGICT